MTTLQALDFKPERNLVGVDDMVMLSQITERDMLDNLKKRYTEGYIYVRTWPEERTRKKNSSLINQNYITRKSNLFAKFFLIFAQTSIGQVLISVNPYKDLHVFSQQQIEKYKSNDPFLIPPHVFSVADEAYRALVSEGESQSIIIRYANRDSSQRDSRWLHLDFRLQTSVKRNLVDFFFVQWRVRQRQDGKQQGYHAVHCSSVRQWRESGQVSCHWFFPANAKQTIYESHFRLIIQSLIRSCFQSEKYLLGVQPAAGILWKCKDFEEQ